MAGGYCNDWLWANSGISSLAVTKCMAEGACLFVWPSFMRRQVTGCDDGNQGIVGVTCCGSEREVCAGRWWGVEGRSELVRDCIGGGGGGGEEGFASVQNVGDGEFAGWEENAAGEVFVAQLAWNVEDDDDKGAL